MPRYLENYKLEIVQHINYDNSNDFFIEVQHYNAKQNGSNLKFILKRFKINPSPIPSQRNLLNLSPQDQQLFEKLNSQTLILKILDHKSIPKCLRILKTSNSIYFVFQSYPFNSLKNYVRKNLITLDQKISLSGKIISTLMYIHSQNIVYKGLKMDNIHIDVIGNIFLTNFKNSCSFQNLNSTKKSLQIIKRERQFLALLKQDILDLAKILFELFQFGKIDPQQHRFQSDIERKLYEQLQEILRKNISPDILQALLKILNERQNIKMTACTDASDSPRSPYRNSIKTQKTHVRTSTSIDSKIKNLRNIETGFNLPLKDTSSRISLFQSDNLIAKQSKTTLSSSTSKLSSSARFFSSKAQFKLSQRLPIQSIRTSRQTESSNNEKEQKNKEIFQSLLKSRKLLQLLLTFIKIINVESSTNLIILLLLKCDSLSTQIKENILLIKYQPSLKRKEKQFISIVNNDNIATVKYLGFVKQSILLFTNLQITNEKIFKTIQQYCAKSKLTSLEENISDEIYILLEKELKIIKKSSSQTLDSGSLINNSKSLYSAEIHKNQNSKNKQFKSLSLLKISTDYQRFQWLYFLSIKLKYNNFEKFYDIKVSRKSSQLDIFKEDYFLLFKSQSIPIDQIVDQVELRLSKYKKTSRPSVLSVK